MIEQIVQHFAECFPESTILNVSPGTLNGAMLVLISFLGLQTSWAFDHFEGCRLSMSSLENELLFWGGLRGDFPEFLTGVQETYVHRSGTYEHYTIYYYNYEFQRRFPHVMETLYPIFGPHIYEFSTWTGWYSPASSIKIFGDYYRMVHGGFVDCSELCAKISRNTWDPNIVAKHLEYYEQFLNKMVLEYGYDPKESSFVGIANRRLYLFEKELFQSPGSKRLFFSNESGPGLKFPFRLRNGPELFPGYADPTEKYPRHLIVAAKQTEFDVVNEWIAKRNVVMPFKVWGEHGNYFNYSDAHRELGVVPKYSYTYYYRADYGRTIPTILTQYRGDECLAGVATFPDPVGELGGYWDSIGDSGGYRNTCYRYGKEMTLGAVTGPIDLPEGHYENDSRVYIDEKDFYVGRFQPTLSEPTNISYNKNIVYDGHFTWGYFKKICFSTCLFGLYLIVSS